ncbi:MAG TPA: YCF48-related protein, partial [Candidatus Kapabacteria bacterium]|nr:YCF48-related protein [Candidatus Kapabacteria bacterium]
SINTVYTLDTSTAIIIGWAGVILETDPSGFHFRASGTQDRLHGIAFPSADTGIIVGDFGTVLQSPDRGVTWNSISTPTSQYLYSVAFANDVVGIAVGDSGTILRTTDEGVTWRGVNNLFTGTNVSIRQVQAFADGTFFAQAWTYLIRSTDFGENWQTVNLPVGDSCGMSFYSPQTGIVAEQMTSSAFAPDTAYFSYTTNAGATWQPFKITMSAYYHILFYWLNDHEALLYGNGFIEDVNLSPSGVTVSRVDNAPQIQVYPNPSIGEVRVDYATKTNGPVQIELWDETGKKVATLFRGEETVGAHEQILDLSKSEHGAYYIRVTQDGTTSTAPITIE